MALDWFRLLARCLELDPVVMPIGLEDENVVGIAAPGAVAAMVADMMYAQPFGEGDDGVANARFRRLAHCGLGLVGALRSASMRSA